MILGGVSFFYFIISKINASIEEETKRSIQVSNHLQILFKFQKKYSIPITIIKKIKKIILMNREQLLDEEQFLQKFMNPLQVQLEYFFYREEIETIILFKNLEQSIIANIGKNIEKIFFKKSNFVIDERVEYLQESECLRVWKSDFRVC